MATSLIIVSSLLGEASISANRISLAEDLANFVSDGQRMISSPGCVYWSSYTDSYSMPAPLLRATFPSPGGTKLSRHVTILESSSPDLVCISMLDSAVKRVARRVSARLASGHFDSNVWTVRLFREIIFAASLIDMVPQGTVVVMVKRIGSTIYISDVASETEM